ncbi:MAG: methyltransferase domain-containing protein [Pseudomonadota bacterium]|nr:methyltransferase domain-containing protein [Pseudomonadota bacterium]
MTVSSAPQLGILADLLVCPACHADLAGGPGQLFCTSCNSVYPLHGPDDSIPWFAQPDQAALEGTRDGPDRKRYEWKYQQDAGAERYDTSFHEQPRKRRRTRREQEIVDQLLSGQLRCTTLLDVPCGGGRLSAPLAAKTEYLLEADISPAQLQLSLGRKRGGKPPVGIVLSALQLPLPDNALDGAVCARLSHHLPEAREREQIITELLRVSRRFVIFSFTDRRSMQSFSRKLRSKALNPSAMLPEEIDSVARRCGARMEHCLTVSSLGPRHRYALLIKE